MTTDQPRLFRLIRTVDHTGASGTGHVADGVCWPDGTVTVRWRGDRASTVYWSNIEDALERHGHGGSTRVEWNDTHKDLTRQLTAAQDALADLESLFSRCAKASVDEHNPTLAAAIDRALGREPDPDQDEE